MVTMELTFLFIYFICFYLYYGWQLGSLGYSSFGLLSAVRRSNLLFCKQRDLDLDLDLGLTTTKYIGE